MCETFHSIDVFPKAKGSDITGWKIPEFITMGIGDLNSGNYCLESFSHFSI